MPINLSDVQEYGYSAILFVFFLWLLYSLIKDKSKAQVEERDATNKRITALEIECREMKEENKKNSEYIKLELIKVIKENDMTFKEHTKAYRENTQMFRKLCEHIGDLSRVKAS